MNIKDALFVVWCCFLCLRLTEGRKPFPLEQIYELAASAGKQHKVQLNPYSQDPPKPYKYEYGVQDEYSGANFGHTEKSDGNGVKGSYVVALPDGRIQRVNYVADGQNGFQAEVTYEGEATYPDHPPAKHSHKHDSSPEYHSPLYYGHN